MKWIKIIKCSKTGLYNIDNIGKMYEKMINNPKKTCIVYMRAKPNVEICTKCHNKISWENLIVGIKCHISGSHKTASQNSSINHKYLAIISH